MTLPPDAPEPDALEQKTPIVDDDADELTTLERDAEAPEADALDQAREVPLDEDDWDR
jgi:hypothetical protein